MVFIFPGTPSLAEPSTLGHVIETVAKETTLADSAEITMEANPTSVEAGKLRLLFYSACNIGYSCHGLVVITTTANSKFFGHKGPTPHKLCKNK
jgi:oxygen-independent coproporphyrinogen-3 oxidase